MTLLSQRSSETNGANGNGAGHLADRELGLADDPKDDVPRGRSKFDRAGALDALVAVLGGVAIAVLLRLVLDWHGILSTVVWSYVGFVAVLFVLVRDTTTPERATDRLVSVFIWSGAALVLAVLVWMLVFLVKKGSPTMGISFFTQDLSKVGPLDPGGGAKAAIVGSFEQVGLATVIVVPLAVLTAVYLHEIKGRAAPFIRFIIDALSGLPSIVAGLLLFSLWVIPAHKFSGAAGSASLIILMIPTVTRTSEEILRTIPDPLREASLALGAPQWRVVLRVVLPTAMAGLVTGVILGIARAVGETAPMILTVSGNNHTSYNPLSGPQSDLPVFIYGLIRVPNKTQNDRAWTAALILVILVLILFIAARLVLARAQRKLRRSR